MAWPRRRAPQERAEWRARAPRRDLSGRQRGALSPAPEERGTSVPTRPPPREDSTWEASAWPGLLQLIDGKHQSPEAGGPRGFLDTGPGFREEWPQLRQKAAAVAVGSDQAAEKGRAEQGAGGGGDSSTGHRMYATPSLTSLGPVASGTTLRTPTCPDHDLVIWPSCVLRPGWPHGLP